MHFEIHFSKSLPEKQDSFLFTITLYNGSLVVDKSLNIGGDLFHPKKGDIWVMQLSDPKWDWEEEEKPSLFRFATVSYKGGTVGQGPLVRDSVPLGKKDKPTKLSPIWRLNLNLTEDEIPISALVWFSKQVDQGHAEEVLQGLRDWFKVWEDHIITLRVRDSLATPQKDLFQNEEVVYGDDGVVYLSLKESYSATYFGQEDYPVVEDY